MTSLRSLSPTLGGSLLIVLGATFAGIIGPLARELYDQGMTPFAFVVWRGIVAGAALWLLVAWRRRRDRAANGLVFGRLPQRERLALIGFITANVVLNTALFVAFDRIPIAIALLTFYLYPVLLALYGRVSGTESLGLIKVGSLVLALAGLALVVTGNVDASGRGLDPLGLALGFLSSVVAAAWVGFGRACPSVPAEQAMGLALTTTVVVVGFVAVVSGPIEAIQFPMDHLGVWPTIIVSGVISGAGAAFLFTLGIRLISRVRAGILGLIEPIVGTAAAAALLGQSLTPVQLFGGALVLGAAVLIQRDAEEAAAASGSAEPIVDLMPIVDLVPIVP
jgi:drug/metabolite transporter (DMT)-like permease